MVSFLLDTNIIIDFFNGDPTIVKNLSSEEIFIASIVVGELYFGAYASSISHNKKKRLEQITNFVNSYPVIEVDEEVSHHYGKIKSALKIMGKPIPENDIWIAAIAIDQNLTLVTRDNHFDHIEGVKTVNW